MRKILAIFAGLVLGALSLVSPAQAAPLGCSIQGGICLRDGGMYGSTLHTFWATDTTACKDLRNNVIDWAHNPSNRAFLVYENEGCGRLGGASSRIYAGTMGDLGGWANRMDSGRWA